MIREHHRIVPNGAVRVQDKQSDAVAYVYTDKARGRPCAMVYFGKQGNPVMHTVYRSEAERERSVIEWFDRKRYAEKSKAETKAARAAEAKTAALGTIFVCSWGYEQTNVDFYQVVEVKKASVLIRQIAKADVGEPGLHGDRGQCVAVPGQFVGEPMLKRVSGGHITIEKGRYANVWDGQPRYWSSYH